jgi:arylsulfatase
MPMTRRSLLAGAASVVAAGVSRAQPTPRNRRPNIILILADDMGFSDLGCYGSEIHTPHLDRLAGQGVRFTQFYNCARCCPSRSSLLTGLYPHQAGIGHMVDQAGPAPGYTDDLSPRSRTIAEVLRASGYQTGMVGKWHVTPVNESKHNWPLQRGFEGYYGIIHGAANYFNPDTLTRDNERITADGKDYYFTDAIGENAVRYLDDFSRSRKPFFLYAAFTAPHWPLHARPDDIQKYEKRYQSGWEAIRRERHERQLSTGLLKRRWELSPHDPIAIDWKDVPDKEWQARRMAVYAAQIDRLDQNIGRILAKLQAIGEEENTMVLFMSDNGGCAEEAAPNWKGIHIPRVTHDGRPVRVGNLDTIMPGAEDTYQSYGVPWANVSNTPMRLYKHWVHEGGISTPLIVRWPERFEQARTSIDEPTHFIDLMATFVDAGEAQYPERADGERIIPMQGRSLLPLISGTERHYDRSIFWEHEGNRAMRHGPWKLVRKFPGEWELYNMDDDRTELRNLAADRAPLLQEMASEWELWAKQAGVLPWDEVRKKLVPR